MAAGLSDLIRAWLVDDYITCHHGDDDLARRLFRYYYDDAHVLSHGRHPHDDAHALKRVHRRHDDAHVQRHAHLLHGGDRALMHGRHRHDDARDQRDAARETSHRLALTQCRQTSIPYYKVRLFCFLNACFCFLY
jgi:hypothetical protein